MILNCAKCETEFESSEYRGYCESCIAVFRGESKQVAKAQHPHPSIFLDGKFTDSECPQSFSHPIDGKTVCGLCGSDDIEPGYGLGSGRGIGGYNWCGGCNSFLDFVEDQE